MARLIQLVDQPISLREAVWAPFQRLGRAMRKKIESITATAEQALEQTGAGMVETIHEKTVAAGQAGTLATAAPPPAAPQHVPTGGSSQLGGALAGGGIAVAALGSSLAFITKTLAGLVWWKIAAGLGGAMVAVIIPNTIVAFFQLRR